MFRSTIVALIVVAAAASSVFSAPTGTTQPTGMFKHEPGAANGLYTHHMAFDGTTYTKYHGMPNVTAAIPATPDANAAKRGDTGVVCQSVTFVNSDALAAIQGLGGVFNANPNFSHSVSFVHGTATAYGCDYGHGQRMSAVEFQGYANDVLYDCGNNKAGYFRLPDAKASYGLTVAGNGFC